MYASPGVCPGISKCAATSGRRRTPPRAFNIRAGRRRAPMYRLPAGWGRYRVRQHQGGGEMLPLKYRSYGRRSGPDLGISMRSARELFFGGLHGQATDHRTVQAQVCQFAIRQFGKFVHRLAVHAVPSETGFCSFDQRREAECRSAFDCAVGGCDCHVRYLVRLSDCRLTAAFA